MNNKKNGSNLYYKKRLVDIYLNDKFIQLLKDYIPDIALQGNCFCPFHDDRNKPSAKVYQIQDGESFLYCYADRHVYKSSDLLLRFDTRRFEEEYRQAFKLFGAEDFEKLNVQYYNELFCSLEYTTTKLDFRAHRIVLKDYFAKLSDLNARKERNKHD